MAGRLSSERDTYRDVALRHHLVSGKLRLPEAREQLEDALA